MDSRNMSLDVQEAKERSMNEFSMLHQDSSNFEKFSIRRHLQPSRIKAIQSICNFLYLFLEMSSIHGLNHLSARKRSLFEHLLWTVLVLLGIIGSISLALSTWRRYQDNPTVVSMERDWHEWNTDFPAITICPTTKSDSKRVMELANRLVTGNDIGTTASWIESLANATYMTFGNILNMSLPLIDPKNLQKEMYAIRPDFSYVVENSVEKFSMPKMWSHVSEMGMCYTYNTRMAYYNSWEYWNHSLNVTSLPSIITGNAVDGDLFTCIKDMNSASLIYFHDPDEIPDIGSRFISFDLYRYKQLDFKALSIVSSAEIPSLSISQRKCRFPPESNLRLSPVYSYNLCRMECRMKQAFKLCDCVPYFYKPLGVSLIETTNGLCCETKPEQVDPAVSPPSRAAVVLVTPSYRSGDMKVCGQEGMKCLAKEGNSLVRLVVPRSEKKLDCGCLPLCESVQYHINNDNDIPWPINTVLKWSISTYPKLRLKRDIIFGFSDLLVSVGGTAGLFLGCSILTVVEVVYFFTFHLFFYIRARYS